MEKVFAQRSHLTIDAGGSGRAGFLIAWLVILLAALSVAHAAEPVPPALESRLEQLYKQWAQVYYLQPDENREAGVAPIIQASAQLQKEYADRPEPLIMEAVARSAWAEKAGKLVALEQAKIAKELLEEAIEMDPRALNGAAWVTLGTLYYRVPGWPVGFGNDKKAREHLHRALQIDENNIDAYFFLGEFLEEDGEEKDARAVWTRALTKPVRERFPVADAGRRRMIQEKLDTLAKSD